MLSLPYKIQQKARLSTIERNPKRQDLTVLFDGMVDIWTIE